MRVHNVNYKWRDEKPRISYFCYPLSLQQDFFNSPLCKPAVKKCRFYGQHFRTQLETPVFTVTVLFWCQVQKPSTQNISYLAALASIQSPFGSTATVKIYEKKHIALNQNPVFFGGAMPISLSWRIQQRTWLKIRIHESWHSPSAGMPLQWTGPRKRA